MKTLKAVPPPATNRAKNAFAALSMDE